MEHDDVYEQSVQLPPSGRVSGHMRRRANAVLPQPFSVYHRGVRVVEGAMLASRCHHLDDERSLRRALGRVVRLQAVVLVTREQIRYTGSVPRCTATSKTRSYSRRARVVSMSYSPSRRELCGMFLALHLSNAAT